MHTMENNRVLESQGGVTLCSHGIYPLLIMSLVMRRIVLEPLSKRQKVSSYYYGGVLQCSLLTREDIVQVRITSSFSLD